MSEQGVDLSQIRGDWKFHMDYLTNAVTQTMKRQLKDWGELSAGANNAGIEEAMTRQKALWDELTEKDRRWWNPWRNGASAPLPARRLDGRSRKYR